VRLELAEIPLPTSRHIAAAIIAMLIAIVIVIEGLMQLIL
jgi:hypothetical protein